MSLLAEIEESLPSSDACEQQNRFARLVMRQLQEQQRAIEQLSRAVGEKASVRELRAVDEGCSTELEAVRQNLRAIEEEQVVEVDGVDEPARDVVQALHRRMTEAEDGIADRPARQEVERALAEQIGRLREEVEALRASSASAAFAARVESTMEDVQQSVDALERGVACKVDKRDASHLESALERVAAYRAFVDEEARPRLQELERGAHAHDETLRRHGEELTAHRQALDAVEATAGAAMPQGEGEELTRRMEAAEQSVRAAAAGEGLSRAEKAIAALSKRLEAQAADVARHGRELVAVTGRAEDTMARAEVEEALARKAGVEDVEHRVGKLAQEVRGRADSSALAAALERVKGLERRVAQLRDQGDVMTRFLDWYASRGEAYEFNMQQVERQMHKLAHASAPQGRTPFSDAVRFRDAEPASTRAFVADMDSVARGLG